MKADFYGPQISPAEFLSERPESNLRSWMSGRAAGTYGFRSSLYSSQFLVGCAHFIRDDIPCPFDWQSYDASEGDHRFHSIYFSDITDPFENLVSSA
jgi:hypothetical protein